MNMIIPICSTDIFLSTNITAHIIKMKFSMQCIVVRCTIINTIGINVGTFVLVNILHKIFPNN